MCDYHSAPVSVAAIATDQPNACAGHLYKMALEEVAGAEEVEGVEVTLLQVRLGSRPSFQQPQVPKGCIFVCVTKWHSCDGTTRYTGTATRNEWVGYLHEPRA